jgi:peptidoglycan lytic transglycosylase G
MLKKLIVAFVALVLLVGVAWGVLQYRLSRPYRASTAAEIFVEVPPGSSVGEIARRLAEAGVISDALTFRLGARFLSLDRHLQAGEYRFTDALTPVEVAAKLAKGEVYQRPVTFPEGLTIKEMAAIFDRSGLGTADEFEQAATDVSLIANFDPDASTLEGFLFPDTYPLPRHIGAPGTVRAMVTAFGHAFDAALRAEAAARQMTPRDVVTLGSIIEKETGAADERALVSAVYHNRLKAGMPLQCDPTVIYALMRRGRWNGNLRKRDLEMDSPYNTYRYPGLPPGPIASPGKASLEAAVRPASVDYLYFVSRNDGTHVFAATLAEHNRNVARWQGKRH